ncbi:hypothetical protein LZQ00_11655 [Sphingobacterium sp. SRCM116780]|uniref:hypothetical protein n=1 Tax=Sphingobacterium sp. SRCM116780 TaxID=2907623 RepID=UPI001F40DC52|nr:hypothetical protein [Sphingobacterium sp. SRCM116780]UIR54934.1 hypothetical protein LZQ00_11655 [Sphingobacterium sp. SRCM116780]
MSLKQILLIIVIFVTASNFSFARLKIPIGEREVLNKVYDLPNTDEFKLENGDYLDLATLHTEFNIAYILPLYITKDSKLVGYNEKTKEFFDIPENELNAILVSQKLNKESINQLPFYTKFGGKLVAVLIIGFLIWGSIPSKKHKIEPKQV